MRKYILITTVLFLISACSFNSLYYYPDKAELESFPDAESFILNLDDLEITGLFYERSAPKASIFFLHGNAGNLNGWSNVAQTFFNEGYQVYLIDYPGFGASTGDPSHKNVIASAQLAFDDFVNKPSVKDTKIILMGFSLGGNLALKIGADNQEQIDAMLLEGAFTDQKSIAADRTPFPMKFSAKMIVKNHVKGKKLIQEFKKPLLIIHSEEDVVCPFEMGEELYELSGSSDKELWRIKGKHLAGMSLYKQTYMGKVSRLIE